MKKSMVTFKKAKHDTTKISTHTYGGAEEITYNFEHFNSITQFRDWLNSTPNGTYMKNSKSSVTNNKSFTGTSTYSQADELLKDGWKEKAVSMTKKIKGFKAPEKMVREFFDVVGGNVSVPRYLQGIPTNMVNKKTIVKKQKIVTLNKSVAYTAGYSTKEIEDEGVKLLQLVMAIEAAGYRVNVNIVTLFIKGGEHIGLKLKIKDAGQRLSVAKMAYPMLHPSMFRRHGFGWLERTELVAGSGWGGGYGSSYYLTGIHQGSDGEFYLPSFMGHGKEQELVDTIEFNSK